MLSLSYSVASQTFVLEPVSSTVLEGSNVTFNATVVGEWQIMTWSIGENLVVTIHYDGDVTAFKNYSAGFCSAGDSRCVAFTIHNVSRMENGSVTCAVQGLFGSKTADLYVQGKAINIWYWYLKRHMLLCSHPLTSDLKVEEKTQTRMFTMRVKVMLNSITSFS